LTRIPVGDDADTINGSVLLKHGSKRILGRVEAEVAYKNIFHLFPSEFAEQ